MKPSDLYLFALYIFALVCALLYLYWRFIFKAKGKRGGSDEENALEKEKEERLFRLYQNMEEMMDNFEAYIEDTREQVESVKTQMQQQADYINGLLQRVEATEVAASAAAAALIAADKTEQKKDAPANGTGKPEEDNGKRYTKQEAIRELLGRGLTVEQIAQKLELSINEVKLAVYGLMTKK